LGCEEASPGFSEDSITYIFPCKIKVKTMQHFERISPECLHFLIH
jgi:hypothetical protein